MLPPKGPALPSSRVLKRLEALHPRTIDLSLGRIERLLAALGHPERKLPPVIHVAGTNGKGSVVAYLRAMFEAAGKRVHVYTSPHLVRFHERIRVAGKLISERELERCLLDCERANGDAPITYFEITTAAAFLAFASTPADVTLLEVGLGGRLDATNVIAKPRVAVITPVALDHQHFLGHTLAAIAGEKAGILKRNVPCVVGLQRAAAAQTIKTAARRAGAPLIRFDREFKATSVQDGFRYRDDGFDHRFALPNLAGPHQIANAAIAIAATRAFGRGAPDLKAIMKGVRTADWPARLQRLGAGELTETLGTRGHRVWLDGGHNPHAARALAREIARWTAGDGKPVYLITGMIESKDPKGFLAALAPQTAAAWCVPVPGEHAFIPPSRLAQIARDAGLKAHRADSLEAAVDAVTRRRPGHVLIAGSLYLAGAVLRADGRRFWPR